MVGILKKGVGGSAYAGAEGEVAAETHSCGADEAGAGRQAQEVIHCLVGVCVIGFECLFKEVRLSKLDIFGR